MSLRKPHSRMSVAEYLELEKRSSVKHEYLDGEIYAMSGASRRHNLIGNNLYDNLRSRLRGGPCNVFTFEVKVFIEALNTFYYPDLVVACDAEDSDEYLVKRPVLVVEVESPATSMIDKREKLVAYRKLDSLIEYVIVSQDSINAEMIRRDKNGEWWSQQLGPGDELRLESVDLEVPLASLEVPLASLYEGIELPTQ